MLARHSISRPTHPQLLRQLPTNAPAIVGSLDSARHNGFTTVDSMQLTNPNNPKKKDLKCQRKNKGLSRRKQNPSTAVLATFVLHDKSTSCDRLPGRPTCILPLRTHYIFPAETVFPRDFLSPKCAALHGPATRRRIRYSSVPSHRTALAKWIDEHQDQDTSWTSLSLMLEA